MSEEWKEAGYTYDKGRDAIVIYNIDGSPIMVIPRSDLLHMVELMPGVEVAHPPSVWEYDDDGRHRDD